MLLQLHVKPARLWPMIAMALLEAHPWAARCWVAVMISVLAAAAWDRRLDVAQSAGRHHRPRFAAVATAPFE